MTARFSLRIASRLALALALPAALSGCANTAGYAGLFLQAADMSLKEALRPDPSPAWRFEAPPEFPKTHSLPSPAPLGALVESSESVCWLHTAPARDIQENPCFLPGAIVPNRLNPLPTTPARYLVYSRSERRAGPYFSGARFKIEPPRRSTAVFDAHSLLRGSPMARARLSLVFVSREEASFPVGPAAPERSTLESALPGGPGAFLIFEAADTSQKPHTYGLGSEYHYPTLRPRLLSMDRMGLAPAEIL